MRFRLFFFLSTLAFTSSCLAERVGVAFDGESTSVRVEAASRFTSGGGSVSAWVRFDHLEGTQMIANRGEADRLFTLGLHEGQLRMVAQAGVNRHFTAAAKCPEAGQWTHVCGTSDGKRVRLYINGRVAAETGLDGKIPATDDSLYIGAARPTVDVLRGRLDDVRLYNEEIAPAEVASIFRGEEPAEERRIIRLTAEDLTERQQRHDPTAAGLVFPPTADGLLPTAGGFHGIWYANEASNDEFGFKYSGGLGTYPQTHMPIAIFRPEVNRTFFVYGGTYVDRSSVLHMISCYDHATGKLARPRVLLDKGTSDAHDNPTFCMDGEGYLWIFSNSHGTVRPSYIHRSRKPYDITAFDQVLSTNFSYGQPWHLDGEFVLLHTRYAGGRALHVMRSADGREWGEPELLAMAGEGHYQLSWNSGKRLGTVFNYHPGPQGYNRRTNLYYMASEDRGRSWRDASGAELTLPVKSADHPALAINYESQGLLVYLKDFNCTEDGRPVALHLTSKGWEAGPENEPRWFRAAVWSDGKWHSRQVVRGDSNYDHASLYIEPDGLWRVIAARGPGPQPFNPGGEIVMTTSRDEGVIWSDPQALTSGSAFNHSYPRRPLNADPGFYAFWADGHARRYSESRLYFCTRDGAVFRMPAEIAEGGEWCDPIPVEAP